MAAYAAPRLLKTFLRSKKPITQAEAANQLGIVPSALTAYLKAIQRPRPDVRSRIAKWTGGKVPEAAWLTARERRALAGQGIAFVPDADPQERRKTGTDT